MYPSSLSTTSPIEPAVQIFTNPSYLKRTTCDLCRERKVRCDRGKPQCGRCKRIGQTCTYPSAGGEVARINSELRSLQSRLRHVECKLEKQDISFPVEFVGPVLNSRFNDSAPYTPQLSSDTTLGDIVIPSDLESWNHAMDFDSLDGLLDHGIPTESNHQCEPLAPDELPSIASDQNNPAIWAVERPHIDQSNVQQNVHPDPRNEMVEISPATMEQLFHNYLDFVHRNVPLIDTTEFFRNTAYATPHQHQGLKYAVAMAGAGSHKTTLHLEQQCYVAARSHLEMAEMHMGDSTFLNLETVQTLILIARYEFTRTHATRAILTMARLLQLVRLLELDNLDRGEQQGGSSPRPAKIDESRNTLWMAYALHCHSSTIFPRCEPLDVETIHTALPCDWQERNGDTPLIFLSKAVTHPQSDALSTLSIFVLAMQLAASTEKHHRMTTANVSGTGAPDYNFCLAHERIENTISMILSALSGRSLQTDPDKELRVLALVITFGARITLYKVAIVNAQKASFLGPVVGESQKIGVLAANAMCDVLLQAEVLAPAHIPMYRATSMFIMRPLSLAAEIQLCVLQSAAQGSGVGIYYMNREIRHSMEVICRAMEAFQEGMSQYDDIIRACREYLDRTQFGDRFSTDFGNKRRSLRAAADECFELCAVSFTVIIPFLQARSLGASAEDADAYDQIR
ncbi:hypothetical protein P168DRAFT_315611 [Aspergillus campestris IBT 28561]|uniref:Zn(2)-C6 fungal-type domain-containing protein n=1 Tax=Aspergillus campestris (strain IBT 28561) TaxID=1392248 RepID=A0A2I1DB39_ASPC2|nr:uncharacterized protein P168DRAFT_315611 [Aspergillus campestris IBT 28561]PKY07087.1 hypothetical protein P168DRAFT_315611 [Aspergillus campestris IBT 28561]